MIEPSDVDGAGQAAGQERDGGLEIVLAVGHAAGLACKRMLGNGSTLTAERARL
jgi:hypothetical protein